MSRIRGTGDVPGGHKRQQAPAPLTVAATHSHPRPVSETTFVPHSDCRSQCDVYNHLWPAGHPVRGAGREARGQAPSYLSGRIWSACEVYSRWLSSSSAVCRGPLCSSSLCSALEKAVALSPTEAERHGSRSRQLEHGAPRPAQGTPQAEDCVCLARSKPGGTRTRTGRRLAQPVSGKAAATGRPTERSPSRRAVSVKKRRKSILTFKYRSKVVNPKSECN